MADFTSPLDIAQRACQHMECRLLDKTLGFNDGSLQATEIGTSYDKLRAAELRANLWRFSQRSAPLRAIGLYTVKISPALWASGTTYFPGAVVSMSDGSLWISTSPNNVGNTPGQSSQWDLYFGPMTADPYDSSISYYAGDLVYTVATNSVPTIYMSLADNNSDAPGTPDTWSATDSQGATQYYFRNNVVTYNSTLYQSLIDTNTITPGTDPSAWANGTTYASGNKVSASDGYNYQSLVNSNTGHNPANGLNPTYWQVIGPTAWTTTITNGSGSLLWAQLSVSVEKLVFAYPLGCGPVQQPNTKNVFRLPANFLRVCPQDPKAGLSSLFGMPAGLVVNDWDFQNDYFTTIETGPILFRFVANMRLVSKFDPMFCEGLAGRIAMALNGRINGNDTKSQKCALAYKSAMDDARRADSIDRGATGAVQDDYITCRW